MKHTLLSLFTLCIALCASAQVPTEYKAKYATLVGKQGEAQILSALFNCISSHTDVGYTPGLWNAYPTTDVNADGNIWDIYSTCTFIPTTDQCGSSYSSVCDCYNREHSIPQSWFGKASPMVADLFHVYPTDAKVNGQRANYPYGECAQGNNLGGHALGRLGSSTFEGYTNVGTVFEPADEYKGDLARTYFYMVACYYDKNFTQSAEGAKVFTYSNGVAGLSDYSVALFLKWARQDSVSAKETNRNQAIYGIQLNRNPFIDCPVLAEYIWGTKAGQAISTDDLLACGCIDDATGLHELAFPAVHLSASEGQVNFKFLPDNATIYTFGATGQLIDALKVEGTETSISLTTGMYMFIVTSEGKQQSFKVLIK